MNIATQSMCGVTRRGFLRTSAIGLTALSAGRVLGANDDIRIAFIGVRLRGPQLIGDFRKVPGVRVVAICDADSEVMAQQEEKLAAANTPVETVTDFRRILDRKDVDAVVIATPDHWHALMTVWACQAGKDVYVEKPVSHNIPEGRQMVAAARKYNRIVQAGTQNRSDIGLQAAAEFLRGGGLGKVKLARVFDNVRRESLGKADGPQPVPPTVDYDLFMGPAPLVPLRRKNLHYDWHFVWPTGTGDCGNRGVHCLDHARWMAGVETLPARVITIAGRLGYDDDGETPNSQITFFDTQPVPMLYELRSLPSAKGAKNMEAFRGIMTTMIIECDNGYLTGGRGGAEAFAPDGRLIKNFKGDSGRTHVANFIAAMRSRKREELRAELLQGHVSTAFCHLANISHLAGQHRPTTDIATAVKDQPLLAESFERLARHLQANEIDLARTPLTLGPMLAFDAEKERFSGEAGDRANALLTRAYREPFVMPERV
ncbi:MAG: Gfo/Idh/MocA family oxidoreductase [Verrucomicrobia bacterium]|nr:Gfo/Idh/MocA family oxidoreductase [Verrucomicrobiota bacterium]